MVEFADNSYRVALICPYFGKPPNYFHLFLESCRRNQTFQFYILCDFGDQQELPDNVKLIQTSLLDVEKAANSKLPHRVRLKHSYKLCDLRPAYAIIFEELVDGFSWWGFFDLDVIWGDLEAEWAKFLKTKKNKFLIRGHLSVFRNTYTWNNLWRYQGVGVPDFSEIMLIDRPCYYDEWGGVAKIIKAKGMLSDVHNPYVMAGVYPYRLRLSLTNTDRDRSLQTFAFKDGKVFRYWLEGSGELKFDEWILIHLQKRVMGFEAEINTGSNFLMDRRGFHLMALDDSIRGSILRNHSSFFEDFMYYLSFRIKNFRMKVRRLIVCRK